MERLRCVADFAVSFTSRLEHTATRPKLTHSYDHCPSSEPFLDKTVGQLLDDAAAKFGARTACVLPFQKIRKSFQELKEDVDAFACGLIELGVHTGDRVGVWGPNSYEWIVAQHAVSKLGGIVVPINSAYKPEELRYCLKKVQVKVLIAAEAGRNVSYYKVLSEILPDLDKSPTGLQNPEYVYDFTLDGHHLIC